MHRYVKVKSEVKREVFRSSPRASLYQKIFDAEEIAVYWLRLAIKFDPRERVKLFSREMVARMDYSRACVIRNAHTHNAKLGITAAAISRGEGTRNGARDR